MSQVTPRPPTLQQLLSTQDEHAARTTDDWREPWSDAEVDPATGTVCIVGKGPDHVLVPWGAPDYEYWGLNTQPAHRGYAPLKCYSRWFQLHPPAYLEKHYPEGIWDLASYWTEATDIRLYMDRHYRRYPDSVPYPKGEVESLTDHGAYHVSSFDWMVALAVLEGWKRIELYGLDFVTFPRILNGEPIAARACLEYWIGVAEGRGSEVVLHQRGDLFKNIHVAVYRSELQYGFEREPALDLSIEDDRWRDVR